MQKIIQMYTDDQLEVYQDRSPVGNSLNSHRQGHAAATSFGKSDFGPATDSVRQQISGSLQCLPLKNSPQVIFHTDPYRIQPEYHRRESFLTPVVEIAIGLTNRNHREEHTRDSRSMLSTAKDLRPKVVASFLGRVENIVGDSASVILINEESGETAESRCDVELLRENIINVGDEFRCEVCRFKGATMTRLFRLPAKTLSKQQVDQIRAAFNNRWTF